jgi:hypothetical protein
LSGSALTFLVMSNTAAVAIRRPSAGVNDATPYWRRFPGGADRARLALRGGTRLTGCRTAPPPGVDYHEPRQ